MIFIETKSLRGVHDEIQIEMLFVRESQMTGDIYKIKDRSFKMEISCHG